MAPAGGGDGGGGGPAVVWDDGSATDTAELLLTLNDCGLSVVAGGGGGQLTPVAAGTLHLLQAAADSLGGGDGARGEGGTGGSSSSDSGIDAGGGGEAEGGASPWLALLHVGGVIVPLPAIAPVARLDAGASPAPSPVPPPAGARGGPSFGEPLLYLLALPDVSFVVHLPAATPAELVAEWEAALAHFGHTGRLPPGGLAAAMSPAAAAAPRAAAPATAAGAAANGAAESAAAADGGGGGPPASAAAAALFRAGGALTSASTRVEAAVREHGGRADAYWTARLAAAAARSSPHRPDTPWTLTPRQRKALRRTRRLTGMGVRLTGGVATRLGGLLASGVASRGGRAAGRVVGGPDGGHRDALRGLLEAGVVSYGAVYTALDETGRALLASTVEGGSEVVAARHGEDAAEATRAVGGIARDAVLMARVVNKAGVKGLTRLVAKRQGKAALHRVGRGMGGGGS